MLPWAGDSLLVNTSWKKETSKIKLKIMKNAGGPS
jgi:hypothetical protein